MLEFVSIGIGDVNLRVVDRGRGRPIVLMHGFPLDHTMWSAQIERLAGHWRVIAPDLRGFGGSEVTCGRVTMEQFADDLAALLDALGIDEPVCLCGLSMGGYVAWDFWRKHAGRLRSLVLCDTRAAADTPETARGRLEMSARVLAEGTSFLPELMLPKLFAPATLQRKSEIVAATRETILSSDPHGVAAAAVGMAERRDASAWLEEINVPALVVVGEHDAISTVAEMRQIAAGMAAARLTVVPEAGHMSPLENPCVVNAALEEFLRSTK